MWSVRLLVWLRICYVINYFMCTWLFDWSWVEAVLLCAVGQHTQWAVRIDCRLAKRPSHTKVSEAVQLGCKPCKVVQLDWRLSMHVGLYLLIWLWLCEVWNFGGGTLSSRAYSFSLLFQAHQMIARRQRRDRTTPHILWSYELIMGIFWCLKLFWKQTIITWWF